MIPATCSARLRQALLLGRVTHGAGNMTVDDALTIATLGGAACLGREKEIGSLEPGKCADVAIFPAEDLFSNGAENPVDALLLCFPAPGRKPRRRWKSPRAGRANRRSGPRHAARRAPRRRPRLHRQER